MSLVFMGSYTPERPVVLSPSDYGVGTIYPIQYKRYTSTSADDDIVYCQWRLNKVRLTIEGSVTLTFYDPVGIDPPEDHTVSFSLTKEATAFITGSDASARLPTALDPSDFASFQDGANDSIPVTTSWGPASIGVASEVSIGIAIGGLIGIEDTTFTNYRKAIRCDFNATGIVPGGFPSSGMDVSTVKGDPSYSALGQDCDPLLHDATPLYWKLTGGGSVTFTTFTLSATDYLPVP